MHRDFEVDLPLAARFGPVAFRWRLAHGSSGSMCCPEDVPKQELRLLARATSTYIIHIPGIRQAQMVQNELRAIDVNVVPAAGYGVDAEQAIREVIAKEFGAEGVANIRQVERLGQTEREQVQILDM